MKIPDHILNTRLGETYEDGDYTLADELKKLKEPIIHASYEMCGPSGESGSYFFKFIVYTKTEVATLVHGLFGDETLLVLPRNPPKSKRNSKPSRRIKQS